MIHFSYKTVKSVSLCCASFFLLSLAPSQDIPLLKRVQEYWKEGDYSLAKRQILNYLEKNPASEITEELHLLLGDLYLQEGNFLTALEEYSKIEKKELLQKTFYNRALCLYEENRTHELLSLSDEISDHPDLTKEQSDSIRYLTASSLFAWQNDHEKDDEVISKVTNLFELCRGTAFEEHSLPPLVEIYLMQGEKGKAADCYISLAKNSKEQSADLLFSAALLLTEENPEKALSLFKKALPLEPTQKGEATYNTIALQYSLKEFKEVLFTYDVYASTLNESENSKASLLVGKSLFYLKDYKEAPKHLLKALSECDLEQSSKKTLRLMVLECAYQTENLSLYRDTKNGFSDLENDEDSIKVHLAYLSLLKLSGESDELIRESSTFLKKYKNAPESEQVLFDKISALYSCKKWKEAEDAISSFLLKYPSGTASMQLERLKLNCAAARLQEGSPETTFILRKHWIGVLENAVEKDGLLNKEEKGHYLLELTKNLFLQEHYSNALEVSDRLLEQYPENTSNFDLQLIITLCYLKDPNAKALFAFHAEKLLTNYPDAPDIDSFRVYLFNAYLQLANESELDERTILLEKAATHLYQIFERNEKDLQIENLEWLAQHYYEKARIEDPASLNRAMALFEALLSPTYRTKEQSEDEVEMHVYKLGKLFSMASLHEKKIDLLEEWIRSHSGVHTPIQKHLIFDLAENHRTLGHAEEALDLYDAIIRSGESSVLGSASVLERAKILFGALPEEERTENNPTCVDILCNIKDIEARRNPVSEPLHLEAGLEYIFLKSSLEKSISARKEKELELLLLFQENFRSAEEYKKKNLQDKWEILDAYMQFAEAKILQHEASSPEELKECKLRLKGLAEASTTPEPLKKRVLTSLQELDKNG